MISVLHFDTKFMAKQLFLEKFTVYKWKPKTEKENIRMLLWNQYKSGVKAAEAARNINGGLAQKVLNPRTASWWFKQFREGRKSIEQKKGQGRPPLINRRVLAQRLKILIVPLRGRECRRYVPGIKNGYRFL